MKPSTIVLVALVGVAALAAVYFLAGPLGALLTTLGLGGATTAAAARAAGRREQAEEQRTKANENAAEVREKLEAIDARAAADVAELGKVTQARRRGPTVEDLARLRREFGSKR